MDKLAGVDFFFSLCFRQVVSKSLVIPRLLWNILIISILLCFLSLLLLLSECFEWFLLMFQALFLEVLGLSELLIFGEPSFFSFGLYLLCFGLSFLGRAILLLFSNLIRNQDWLRTDFENLEYSLDLLVSLSLLMKLVSINETDWKHLDFSNYNFNCCLKIILTGELFLLSMVSSIYKLCLLIFCQD